MADIAQIGFRADTSDLKDAKTDLNALVPAAKNAERASESFTQKAVRMGDTLSGKVVGGIGLAKTALVGFAAGVLGALSVGAITAALSETADRLDDISKAASKLKVNAGDLQGLGYAADLAGVSFDQLATVANKMNRVIGQAIAKGKENEGVFKLLGISAKELAALPIDERFSAIADKMNAMNLSADQTALILGQLGDRSGSLAALFEGGSDAIREASDQLDRFNGKISNEQGKEIEAMNDAFTSLGYSIQAATNQLVAFVAPYIAPVVNAVAELVGWFNRSTIAATAFKAVFAGIATAFSPVGSALAALGTLFQRIFGTTISQAIKSSANFMINAWTGAYQAVGIIWQAFPSLIADAAVSAVNFALKQIDRLVQSSLAALNGLASALSKFGGGAGGDLVDASKLKIPEIPNPFRDDTVAAFNSASDTFQRQMQVNNFAVDQTKDDLVQGATPAMKDFAGALDTAGSSASGAAEKLTELQKIGQELDKIGAPFEQAKSAFDKLKELQTNGIITNDQYAASLERIKNAFIATGGTADQWGKIITTKTNEMTTALKDFSTNALTQTGDAIAELAVTGKADFKALAESILKDLIRMAWQALVVKPIIGSIFGFADGGVFSGGAVQKFASGGMFTNKVVTKPTTFAFANGAGMQRGLMGEAGPEAIMPLRRGKDGSLGVEAHGFGGGGNVNSLSFGDINVNVQSTGNADDDERMAKLTADAFEERVKTLAAEQFASMGSYGGVAQPRGIRNG